MRQNIIAMEVTKNTADVIKLIAGDIMYIERPGHRSARELREAYDNSCKLAAQLRQEGKPVLILNHAHGSSVSERVVALLLDFDFDRLAVFGTDKRVNNLRDLMARANGLEDKIASFETREEALTWLRAY